MSVLCLLFAFHSTPMRLGADGTSDPGAPAGQNGTASADYRYAAYMSGFDGGAHVHDEVGVVTIRAAAFESLEGNAQVLDEYAGRHAQCLWTGDSGIVTWSVDIEVEGLYNVAVAYSTVAGRSANPERRIFINGVVPFFEANFLTFRRLWRDRSPIARDQRDNDIRPTQVEHVGWQTAILEDYQGYYQEPFLFFFPKGRNTISFESVREDLVIDEIRLIVKQQAPTYVEVRERHPDRNGSFVTGAQIKVQGEHAYTKSSPTLYPIYDRTSPTVEPYHRSKIRMNAIGGVNWREYGQEITWKVDVPVRGLYQLAIKAKQNINRGRFSTRRLLINGEVPFREAEALQFTFSNGWRNYLLLDPDGTPFLFELDEGENTITLSVVLGEMADIVRTIEASLRDLNTAYRRIVMITSTSPDIYRDYDLDKQLPTVMEIFREQSEVLTAVFDEMVSVGRGKGPESALVYRIAHQLSSFYRDPKTIARRLDAFKSNLGGLGALILSLREQPLTVDYLLLGDLQGKMPKAEAGLLRKVVHEVSSFVASFTEDYNTVGTVHTGQEVINTWIVTGRDQAQIVKSLADETFTPSTGVSVNIKLVDTSAVLPATMSGNNPDVVLQLGTADPVNYAMRGALVDLSRFEDYGEVERRFYRSAIVPYEFNGGVYALPETQQFLVMFYRKDIFRELGISPPETWEEVYWVLAEIQKNYLELGLPYTAVTSLTGYGTLNGGLLSYAMFLSQRGGTLYREGGRVSNVDSEEGIEAFKIWTEFYSNYKLPLTYNFANRFRLGEMPIAVTSYVEYNLLSVFAPEIKGLWDFTLVPGLKREDGTIDRSVPSTGNSAVIFQKNNTNVRQSWEFLKWWTSAATQERFGREMENLMGAAARYPTANVEAASMLPWSSSEFALLRKQWEWVVGIPEVPGGYFTPRHMDNAFRSVVYSGNNPRETLLDYIRFINEELESKQIEFGLREMR